MKLLNALALAATVIVQSIATANTAHPLPIFFGLDWFAINVLFTGLIFIPIERLCPQKEDQSIFRDEWREDVFYVLVSSLMVQALAFLPQESFGFAMVQVIWSIVCYPVVVFLSRYVLDLHKPAMGEVDAYGRRM